MTREALNAHLSEHAAHMQSALADVLSARAMPDGLRESMAYSLLGGGKFLRSALCLESCRLLNGDIAMAKQAACAIEMIHSYSLIHDDLPAMDNDDMRRGKPSNHKVFGEAGAILAGDGLLSLALELLSGACNQNVIHAVAEGAFDMVAGQSLDLLNADGADALYEIHRLKTGALIKAAIFAGAFCDNPDERDIKALSAFSEAFGLLFQITDDILDVTGNAANLGKTIGKDAREGKLTFVTHYGLEAAKRHAEEQADATRAALAVFDDRASFFLALTDATLARDA